MSGPKPGDTVDPRTLPVGAEWHYASYDTVYRITRPGRFASVDHLDVEMAIGNPGPNHAILISLPQPIADEVVELGTLAVGANFEFESPSYPRGSWYVHSTNSAGRNVARFGSREALYYAGVVKVRRVPAPTPTRQPGAECGCRFDSGFNHTCAACKANGKRPPCDVCGKESVPYNHDPSQPMHDSDHRIGPVYLCSKHWLQLSSEEYERLVDRHAKLQSGVDPAVPGSERTVEATYRDGKLVKVVERKPPDPRWQTTDPARIAALEAKLAEQVGSGGQDTPYARGRVEAREKALLELDRPIAKRILGKDGGYRDEALRSGIGGLRLERPLISWKRRP